MDNRHVELAQHALGMNYKKPYIRHGKKFYKPYRNYFSTCYGCDYCELWEELTKVGYAKSRETQSGKMFWMTREGLDWLGEIIGVHIYDEEE